MARYRLITEEFDGVKAVSTYMPLVSAVSWARDHVHTGMRVLRIESETGDFIEGEELSEVLTPKRDGGSAAG